MRIRIILAATISACAGRVFAETAAVKMKGTAAGSAIAGSVILEDAPDGLKVSARLEGVPAGNHGFHIHEFGSCEDLGKAAGGHFNPRGATHGNIFHDGSKKAHAGDMGNIMADKDGKAALEALIPRASLGGKRGMAGRAVVLHEQADDLSQPTGNAGGRIACGVIGITGK